MDACVLIATASRPESLARTLRSLADTEPGDLNWRVVVIDNAPDDATRTVLRESEDRLPLVALEESTPGKNQALNRGLAAATSADLLLFTDDDVTVRPDWVMRLVAGARAHPDVSVFGGPIEPAFPEGVSFDLSDPLFRSAFVLMDRGPVEATVPPTAFWGPNVAIRGQVFFRDGLRFDTSVGPDGTTSYLMGSETEFLDRLERSGHEGLYLPDTLVTHHIRHDQTSLEWLAARAYRQGLAEGWRASGSAPGRHLWGAPLHVVRNLAMSRLRAVVGRLVPGSGDPLRTAMLAAYWRGRLAGSRRGRILHEAH